METKIYYIQEDATKPQIMKLLRMLIDWLMNFEVDATKWTIKVIGIEPDFHAIDTFLKQNGLDDLINENPTEY